MSEQVQAVRAASKPKWIPMVLVVIVLTSLYLSFADENIIDRHIDTVETPDRQHTTRPLPMKSNNTHESNAVNQNQISNNDRSESNLEANETAQSGSVSSAVKLGNKKTVPETAKAKNGTTSKSPTTTEKKSTEAPTKPKNVTTSKSSTATHEKKSTEAPTKKETTPKKGTKPTPKKAPKAPEESRKEAIPTKGPDLYPIKNLVEDFPTVAAREEARRHDRVIVDSMAYFEGMSESVIKEWNNASNMFNASDLCINIFTSNRKIRYVDALLMMLMKGQTKKRLLSYAKINLLNIERRPERADYPHLKRTLSRFDFLNVYNITKDHPLGPDMPFLTALRLDTVSALNFCVKSKLPYCLMLEDDALPASGFIDSLEKTVISPLRRGSLKASSVSLYSYHSNAWSRFRLDQQPYIDNVYYGERSKNNAERRAEGLKEYEPTYRVGRARANFGAVANLYTLEMATKLRDFLKTYGNKKKVTNADILMNKHFVKKVKLPRMQTEPSLVNHIGFYSERRNVVSYVNSDVRFQLDAGDY